MRRAAPSWPVWALVPMLACGPDGPAPESATRPREPAELSAAALRNASFGLPYAKEPEVRLTEGVFRDTAQRVTTQMLPEYAVGDLDGDGVPDAAIVLATNTGGSGVFHDLVAVVNAGGVPRSAATEPLGDRVVLEGVRIGDGEIRVELTSHGPGDPMCCPTLRGVRRFRLVADGLHEVMAERERADGG